MKKLAQIKLPLGFRRVLWASNELQKQSEDWDLSTSKILMRLKPLSVGSFFVRQLKLTAMKLTAIILKLTAMKMRRIAMELAAMEMRMAAIELKPAEITYSRRNWKGK